MNRIETVAYFLTRQFFEPTFDWVLDHSVISVLVVIGLIYWSVRGYRML